MWLWACNSERIVEKISHSMADTVVVDAAAIGALFVRQIARQPVVKWLAVCGVPCW